MSRVSTRRSDHSVRRRVQPVSRGRQVHHRGGTQRFSFDSRRSNPNRQGDSSGIRSPYGRPWTAILVQERANGTSGAKRCCESPVDSVCRGPHSSFCVSFRVASGPRLRVRRTQSVFGGSGGRPSVRAPQPEFGRPVSCPESISQRRRSGPSSLPTPSIATFSWSPGTQRTDTGRSPCEQEVSRPELDIARQLRHDPIHTPDLIGQIAVLAELTIARLP